MSTQARQDPWPSTEPEGISSGPANGLLHFQRPYSAWTTHNLVLSITERGKDPPPYTPAVLPAASLGW